VKEKREATDASGVGLKKEDNYGGGFPGSKK
jgi:hypothetical protein